MSTALILYSFFALRLCPPEFNVQPFLLVVRNPYPEIYKGCDFDKGTRLIFVDWVIIAVVEAGTLNTNRFRGFRLIGLGTTQLCLF